MCVENFHDQYSLQKYTFKRYNSTIINLAEEIILSFVNWERKGYISHIILYYTDTSFLSNKSHY